MSMLGSVFVVAGSSAFCKFAANTSYFLYTFSCIAKISGFLVAENVIAVELLPPKNNLLIEKSISSNPCFIFQFLHYRLRHLLI